MRKTTTANRLRRGSLNWRLRQAWESGGASAALLALRSETVTTAAGCWLWQRSTNGNGYGRHGMHADVFGEACAGNWHTHRLAYWLANGELHHADAVHHACGNTLCCNPAHLQRISQRENAAEMLERKAYRGRIADLEDALAASIREADALRSEVRRLETRQWAARPFGW